jgi:hypothetical protein
MTGLCLLFRHQSPTGVTPSVGILTLGRRASVDSYQTTRGQIVRKKPKIQKEFFKLAHFILSPIMLCVILRKPLEKRRIPFRYFSESSEPPENKNETRSSFFFFSLSSACAF